MIQQHLGALLPHEDGGAGRTAAAHEGRKGGNDEDNGHTKAHARQGEVAVERHTPDIDAVNDVIEHVDQLRQHRGDGQLCQQAAHWGCAEKFFVLHGTPVLLGKFFNKEQYTAIFQVLQGEVIAIPF